MVEPQVERDKNVVWSSQPCEQGTTLDLAFFFPFSFPLSVFLLSWFSSSMEAILDFHHCI
jgi:hypothetical protein